MSSRPFVWLHSCAVIPECDCGDREWEVQPPDGYQWSTIHGPGAFSSMEGAIAYARCLHPDHSDMRRL